MAATRVLDEAGASVLSQLTFSWAFPLLRLGARRPLEAEDLGAVGLDLGIPVGDNTLR